MARLSRDPTTLSNYQSFKVRHTAVDFNIDFSKKVLAGSVTLNLEATNDAGEKHIHLDTSYLDIEDVKINAKDVQWTVHPRVEPFGSKLEISLESAPKTGDHLAIDVSDSEESGIQNTYD